MKNKILAEKAKLKKKVGLNPDEQDRITTINNAIEAELEREAKTHAYLKQLHQFVDELVNCLEDVSAMPLTRLEQSGFVRKTLFRARSLSRHQCYVEEARRTLRRLAAHQCYVEEARRTLRRLAAQELTSHKKDK